MDDLWNKYWSKTESIANTSPYAKWLRAQRLKTLVELLLPMPKRYKIIEQGCGAGDILLLIHQLGFNDVVGIDLSKKALELCKKKGFEVGKDVYLMDASHTIFKSLQFDIVISEGLWEHFDNPIPMIHEASRLSKQIILAYQPNMLNPITRVLWLLSLTRSPPSSERLFPPSYYSDILSSFGFDIVTKRYTILHEQVWLLWRRTN